MRIPVPLPKAYRLLNHGPTTLVSSAHDGRANVMAAAWVMPLDFDPPKLAVVIAKDTFTRSLVDASGELVVAVPTLEMAPLVRKLGTESGESVDKIATHGLAVSPASKVKAPLVEGCVAWLEGVVLKSPELAQDHDLFLVEVVAAWADDEVFREGRWHFTDDRRRSIHHVAGGMFFVSGDPIETG